MWGPKRKTDGPRGIAAAMGAPAHGPSWAWMAGRGGAQACGYQCVPELPTEDVQEFKVVWTCKKKFHLVLLERACTQR